MKKSNNNQLFSIQKNHVTNFTDVDKLIIKKIQLDPWYFIYQNISEFSSRIYVSPSAISRLVKKLGYKNIQVLKITLMEELNKKSVGPNHQLTEHKQIFQAQSQTKQSNIIIDDKIISSIEKSILNTSTIFAFGLGASRAAANEFSKLMIKHKIIVICPQDLHELLLWIDSKKEKSLIFIFSHNLASREMRFLIENENRNAYRTFVITSNQIVKRIKFKNYILYQSEDAEFSSINSIVSQLKISQKLVQSIIERFNQRRPQSSFINTHFLSKKWNNIK